MPSRPRWVSAARRAGPRTAIACATLSSLLVARCDADPQPPATAAAVTWECPRGWVRAGPGGCGPALVLCGPGARAEAVAPGACAGVDVAAGVATTARDGSAGPTWSRAVDGTFLGAWPRDGAASTGATPPADDWLPELADDAPGAAWSPEAGIPGCTTGWPCAPTLRGDCPVGSAALPSGACVAVGADACPATSDPWPDAGPADPRVRVARVRADAPSEGADGSAEHPYPTIGAALAAGAGAVRVLLADGEHVAPARVEGEVSIRGRCAARAIVGGPASVAPLALEGAASRVELAGVTVRDRGVRVAGATATLRGVVIARATGIALRAGPSAVVDLHDVHLDGTVAGASVERGGLWVDAGATVDGERVAVRGTHRLGAAVIGRATLRDVAVRSTVRVAAGESAQGLIVQAGGSLTLSRALVEDIVGSAVLVTQSGSSATLSDCALRRVAPASATSAGSGLTVSRGATASLDGSLVESAGGFGVYAHDGGTRLAVSRSTLRRNGTPAAGALEVSCADGASTVVTGVAISDTAGVALHATGAGATLRATGVRVERVDQDGMGRGARAILAQEGAALTATDVRLADVTGVGASAVGEGSRLTLDRAVIVGGGAPSMEPTFPEGVAVAAIVGGAVEGTRVRVVRAHTTGVFAYGEAGAVTLAGSCVEGVAGRADRAGYGALALRGGAVTLRGVRVREATGSALAAAGEGTRVTLDGVVVEATRATPAASAALQAQEGGAVEGARVAVRGGATGGVLAVGPSRVTLSELRVADCDARLGYGLAAQDGAEVSASRARVSRCSAAGLFVAGEGARMSLADAVVEGTVASAQGGGFGARVQSGGALTLTRAVLAGNTYAAVASNDAGTRVVLADVAMRDTRAVTVGGLAVSLGVLAQDGAVAEADRTVTSGMEGAAFVLSGATLDLRDAFVVSPRLTTAFGGFGVLAAGRSTARVERLAVVAPRGVAASVADAADARGTTLTARDLYVSGVVAGAVDPAPDATAEAYGVSVDEGGAVDLSRAVFDGGGWGFFQTLGTLRLRDVVIARQRAAAGASNGASAAGRLTLERVSFAANARDEVAREVRLPPVRIPVPRLAD